SYWGTSDPAVIAARIFDFNDDFVPGTVDFSGFLGTPEPAAPAIQRPATNVAPLANAGSDQVVAAGTVVTLDGSLSFDLNGDPLTFQWTPDPANPQPVTLSSSTAMKPTFTPTITGTYRFTLVVNDGQLNSAPATVQIRVFAAGASLVSGVQ